MAVSIADIGKILVALAGTLALSAALQAAGVKAPAGPIEMTADHVDFDYKNKTMTYKKVRIAQGTMAITADTGQGAGTAVQSAFDDSRWVFRGNVKITMDQGVLNSDEADVTFVNKAVTTASANGKPATFQQKIAKSDKTAQGHSDNISYDVAKGVVHLSKNAWLSDGQNEIRGETVKYDTAAERIIADAAEQGQQRVHIILPAPAPKP